MPRFRPMDGVVRVSGSGDAATDTAEFQLAATEMAAQDGKVVIDGDLLFSSHTSWTGALSIDGVNNARILSSVTTSGNLLEWNPGINQAALEAKTGPDAPLPAGGAARTSIIGITGHNFVAGDWIIITGENQVPGCQPHHGTGTAQTGTELHLIDAVEPDVVRIAGTLSYDYTIDGRGLVMKVPMSYGVTVSNVRFDFDPLAGSPAQFAGLMRFRGCVGAWVEPNCTVLRNGPGAIWMSLTGNSRISCDVLGAAREDDTYGTEVDTVNGIIIDGNISGTRHPFTTTASKLVSETTFPVTVDTVGNILDAGTAHNFENGFNVYLEGTTPPDGVSFKTNYYVVNKTTNTVQLAAAPGGTPLDLGPSAGTGVELKRWLRSGTPKNVTVFINGRASSKGLPASGSARTFLDTHPEGDGIIFDGGGIDIAADESNYCFNFRARNTVLRNYTARSLSSGNARGGRIIGSGVRIEESCTFEGFWEGIEQRANDSDQTFIPTDTYIGAKFINIRATPIKIKWGSCDIHNASFKNAGQQIGGFPYSNRSLIAYETPHGGQTIRNCIMPKDANDRSIDPGQLDETQLKITSNDITGYGNGETGIGKIHSASFSGTTITTSGTNNQHGYSVDQQVAFVSSDGNTPPEIALNTRYFVVSVPTSTTMEIGLVQSGSPISFSSDPGTVSVVSPYYTEIRGASERRNTYDTLVQLGQITDGGGAPTQVLTAATPEPVTAFTEELATGDFAVDAPSALIQMPTVDFAERLWVLNFGGSLAASSNNVLVTFSYWVNGSYFDDVTTVSIQQSGNSQSVSIPNVFFQLPAQAAPKVQLYVETSSSTTLTYTVLSFNIARVEI